MVLYRSGPVSPASIHYGVGLAHVNTIIRGMGIYADCLDFEQGQNVLRLVSVNQGTSVDCVQQIRPDTLLNSGRHQYCCYLLQISLYSPNMAPSIWSSFLKAPYTPIRPEEASKEKLLYPGVGNNSDPESEHEPPQAALKLLWRWKLAAITSTSLLVLFILILSMLPSSETRKIPTIYCKLRSLTVWH